MNPENNDHSFHPASIVQAPVAPHPVNQVTILSKYLAMALFIAMPFIGAYIGYQLVPVKIVEVPIAMSLPVVTRPLPTAPETDTSDTSSSTNPDVFADVQHILYKGERTGYFVKEGKVYFARVQQNEGVGHPLQPGDVWVEYGQPTLVIGADPITFKVIASEPAEVGTLYAVDANGAYAGTTTLKNVDLASVETFGRGDAFLISDKGIYLGASYIPSGLKKDTEIYWFADSNDAYSLYIHDVTKNTWMQTGGQEIIDTLKLSVSKPDLAKLTKPLTFR